MGRIWMPGGGGGADLDVVTAEAKDVLAGKVIVDKDGNPLSGTMQTMSGGTYTPSTSQQRISCAEKKMTSDIVIPAFSLPSADCIISGKSVTIYGKTVKGTAEQFLSSPSVVLGLASDNSGGFSSNNSSANITHDKNNGDYAINNTGATTYIRSNNAFNLTPYKYLKAECRGGRYNNADSKLTMAVSTNPNYGGLVAHSAIASGSRYATLISDVTSLKGMYYIYFVFEPTNAGSNGVWKNVKLSNI